MGGVAAWLVFGLGKAGYCPVSGRVDEDHGSSFIMDSCMVPWWSRGGIAAL